MTCGILIGVSKTGISGAGLFVVPVFAKIFGAKPSTGLVLPLLIFADIFAVSYYNRHANWKYVLKLIPWAVAGILIATFVGRQIDDVQFRQMIAVIVLLGIGLMIFQDFYSSQPKVPDYWWMAALLGLGGGFATMIGNAAGPIMSLYLLSMRLPKNIYIGTGAWFFFIVNVFKVPFHVFAWETINFQTLGMDLFFLIPILIGTITGIYLVKLLPEKIYRWIIIISTIISALVLF